MEWTDTFTCGVDKIVTATKYGLSINTQKILEDLVRYTQK